MIALNQIIDLSVGINPDLWEPEPVKRVVVDHKAGADKLGKSYLYFKAQGFWRRLWAKYFPSKAESLSHHDFPDEMGLSLMFYHLSTHTGTHVDAPFHYGWRSDSKEEPIKASEIPLSWCYGPGVLLDFSADRSPIDAERVQTRLAGIPHSLSEGEIVLINTGAGRRYGRKDYFTDYRGIEASAIAWLLDQGIRVIGTDAFSFDKPFCEMIAEYKRSGDKNALWPAHFYGRDRPYLQIERLTNLESLQNPTGFRVCCFPIKLEKADAAWSRVVAILDAEVATPA